MGGTTAAKIWEASMLLALLAAAAWSPPAQAAWPGEMPHIEVRVRAKTLSMRDKAQIDVDLLATGEGFAVSPFLQTTRGIAFDVTLDSGQPATPAEPMVGSPPPPPLEVQQLVPVSQSTPYHVTTQERAGTIFPGPGRYKIKAHVFLFSFPSSPVRYAELISKPVSVVVTN